MTTETALMRAILVELSRHGCLVFRNNVGMAVTRDGNPMRFGLPGSADIIGCAPGGRFLAVEVKTPQGRLLDQQRKFGRAVEQRGGIYVVARSVEDAVAAVNASNA